jgi:exodeoxyribonuclease VII large subunit
VDQQERVKRNLESFEATLRKAIDDLIFRTQQTLDFLKERVKSPDRILQERVEKLRNWRDRMTGALDYRLGNLTVLVTLLRTKLASAKTLQTLPFLRQKINHEKSLILKSMAEILRMHEEKQRRSLTALQALNPYRVLERGYAIVTKVSDGAIVKVPQDVQPGEKLRIRLAKGEIFCIAEGAVRGISDE